MTRKGKIVTASVFLACLLAILVWQVTSSETARIAREAYIYGYPLVTFDMVRKQQTNVYKPDDEHAPMGQLVKMRNYPPVERRAAAVNADTLYTLVWLDVSTEPWIFSIPDMGDRYYIMPMHDGFSEVFMAAGALLTGGKPQTYAITGPGWSGTLPNASSKSRLPRRWYGFADASTARVRPRTMRRCMPSRTGSPSFPSVPMASPTHRSRAQSIPAST